VVTVKDTKKYDAMLYANYGTGGRVTVMRRCGLIKVDLLLHANEMW
jgi:hypothetical protein